MTSIQLDPNTTVVLKLPAAYVLELITGMMERPKRIADVVIAEIEKQALEQHGPKDDKPAEVPA